MMTNAETTTTETDATRAMLSMPKTITPPLRAWLEPHIGDPKLAALVIACHEADERLSNTRERHASMASLIAANDDAIAAAGETSRIDLYVTRANLLAERDALPEQVRRDAEARAWAALRVFRAIRMGAQREHDELHDRLQPSRAELAKRHSDLARDQSRSKHERLRGDELTAYRHGTAELARSFAADEARQAVCRQAYQSAHLTANGQYGDPARGVRVNLDTNSERSWDRVVSHYMRRYSTEGASQYLSRIAA